MSITDELREWVRHIGDNQHLGILTDFGKQGLTNLADRIDAEHAKARDKAYFKGVCDGIDADKNAMGYIKLPVDADGVPIHMGDEMELTDEAARRWDVDKHFGKVMGLELTVDGWTVEGDPATDLRHVQPDTWERIIEDAIDTAFEGVDDESEFDLKKMELVDRCRRLAGEDA